MSEQCKFNKAWVGRCKEEADESGFCEEHRGMVCSSCGAVATRNCSETMGPLVCGAPLCDDCEHTIQSNGCSNMGELPEGMKGHCRKGEQRYHPWYVDEDALEKYPEVKERNPHAVIAPDRGTW